MWYAFSHNILAGQENIRQIRYQFLINSSYFTDLINFSMEWNKWDSKWIIFQHVYICFDTIRYFYKKRRKKISINL